MFNKKLFFLCLVVPLIWTNTSHSDENYTGRWYVSISGQLFVMDLTQRGNEVQGIMIPETKNKSNISIIHGTENNKIIELFASNKDLSIVYRFYGGLIGGGKEESNDVALVGHFTRNNQHYNRWHAIRYDQRSYYGSLDRNYSIFHNFDTRPNPF